MVKPETVIVWHRKGFRLYWSWKSRPRQGRPSVSTELQEMIRRMSAANPGWGAPRIHGELGKLGIQVSETTAVAKYRVVLQVSNADKFVAERLSCVLRLPTQKGCR